MVIGIPANLLILFVNAFDLKTKKNPSTIFLNNLAVADLIMLLFRYISAYNRLKIFQSEWDFGQVLCYAYTVFPFIVTSVSIFMIMLISIDRYGAIKFYKQNYLQVSKSMTTNSIDRFNNTEAERKSFLSLCTKIDRNLVSGKVYLSKKDFVKNSGSPNSNKNQLILSSRYENPSTMAR